MQRRLKTYGNYFLNFYNALGEDVQEKIDWVFEVVKTAEQIPKKFFEHLSGSDGIYAIRMSTKATSIGYYVSTIKEISLCWSTLFRKRHRKHRPERSPLLKN